MPNARSALTASPALAYTVERAPVFPSMLLGAPVSPSKNRSFGGFSPAMSRIKTRCSHSMPTIWAAVSAMKLLVARAVEQRAFSQVAGHTKRRTVPEGVVIERDADPLSAHSRIAKGRDGIGIACGADYVTGRTGRGTSRTSDGGSGAAGRRRIAAEDGRSHDPTQCHAPTRGQDVLHEPASRARGPEERRGAQDTFDPLSIRLPCLCRHDLLLVACHGNDDALSGIGERRGCHISPYYDGARGPD